MTKLTRSEYVKRAELLTFFALIAAAAVFFLLLDQTPQTDKAVAACGDYVEVYGVDIHYIEAGSGGRAFLLLHGFGANIYTWRELISPLSRLGRVVAVDRPGFGFTERVPPGDINPYTVEGEAALLVELLRKLNITRAVVVAHSSGAATALYMAQLHPELVEALVLIAPSVRQPRWRLVAELPLSDVWGPLFIKATAPLLERLLYEAWFNKSRLTPDVVAMYKAPLKLDDWHLGLYWVVKYRKEPQIDFEKILQPTAIIHCEEDKIVPLRESLELHNKLRNSTVRILSSCGHLPHEEVPELVARQVEVFLNR